MCCERTNKICSQEPLGPTLSTFQARYSEIPDTSQVTNYKSFKVTLRTQNVFQASIKGIAIKKVNKHIYTCRQ